MIIASNFKTNHTRASSALFLKAVSEHIKKTDENVQVRVYPTATALDGYTLPDCMKLGAQNIYPATNGSFTGEIGYEQIEEFGIDTLLVGHSERRHVLGESNEFCVQKYNFAKEKNLEILYCIGEPKEVRQKGIEAVMEYLWKQLEGIDLEYERVVIAYEPVWAIGTGLTASKADIQEVLEKLAEKTDKPLLYGGSVKVDNISDILEISGCSGVLVGTASWKAEAFIQMIEAAQKI